MDDDFENLVRQVNELDRRDDYGRWERFSGGWWSITLVPFGFGIWYLIYKLVF